MRDLYEQIVSVFWVAVHHRWAAFFAGAIICFLGWVVVYLLPDQYQVYASVYFDDETALTPVLEGIATKDFSGDERAMIVRRTLTNEKSLIEIAKQSGKDLSQYSVADAEEILFEMFENISIENERLSATNFSSSQNLYSITYTDSDPEFALNVVNSIIDLFIKKFINTAQKGNEKVAGFLEENIDEYKSKLEEAENNLKEFKQKHPNLTQQTEGDFFVRLNQIKSDIEEVNIQLIEERNRNVTLKSQLNRVISDNKSSAGAQLKAQELTLIEQRILDVERKLAELKLQFTDKHPDVLANERILNQLIEQKAQEDRAPITTSVASPRSLVNSELYQQLQLNVSESNSRIAALNARKTQYNAKLDLMNEQVNTMPEIEAELVRLTRDYNITKDTYDSLVQRRSSTQLSRQAEKSSQELQYQIIDEPFLPASPSFPNRKILSTVALLAGLVGGLVVAWLLEQFNPKIYKEQQIADEFGLAVYGNVPMYWSSSEIIGRRAGGLFLSLLIIGLIASYFFVMVHYGFSVFPYIELVTDFIGQKTL